MVATEITKFTKFSTHKLRSATWDHFAFLLTSFTNPNKHPTCDPCESSVGLKSSCNLWATFICATGRQSAREKLQYQSVSRFPKEEFVYVWVTKPSSSRRNHKEVRWRHYRAIQSAEGGGWLGRRGQQNVSRKHGRPLYISCFQPTVNFVFF